MSQTLGIYLSIPFCKAKCSFCNFASDVFGADRMQGYVDLLCTEIRQSRALAVQRGALVPAIVDTVYFGGGTPSLLSPALFRQIFDCLRSEFQIAQDAEITIECAPGQLPDPTLEELQRQGMNRLSFGVQSFIDRESAAVGRLHTERQCLQEFTRMRRAGIGNLSLDLIVGLPHQTAESWLYTVDRAIDTSLDHVSVYMLEVDEDSRLGREALANGRRYGAAQLPDEDAAADWYLAACERLAAAGIDQYEISNFSRPLRASKHNLKYWTRDPYMGFGLDAHSMLLTGSLLGVSIRWANKADLDLYLQTSKTDPLKSRFSPKNTIEVDHIDPDAAFEETMFLGLRLNAGLDLTALRDRFGSVHVDATLENLCDVEEAGLLVRTLDRLQLTDKGRMISNEVFSRLLLTPVA